MSVPGLVSVLSRDAFATTVARLDAVLERRGINPLLQFDHAAAAASAGLALSPMLLVMFGDPKVGTPVMQEAPTAGIDLPLRILVWEVRSGSVHVGYNDPAWIEARHGIAEPSGTARRMAALLHDLALIAAGIA